MRKSDIASTKYKNILAFGSLQHLADKYKLLIIRVYEAARHGKGLVDIMSNLKVKSV